MIENVINNKGGLHNRVSRTIRLFPFSLKETQEYLVSRHYAIIRRTGRIRVYHAVHSLWQDYEGWYLQALG